MVKASRRAKEEGSLWGGGGEEGRGDFPSKGGSCCICAAESSGGRMTVGQNHRQGPA